MQFSNLKRSEYLEKFKGEIFDVLVIGGGITGAGIAFDAASRGMKVALVEMQDFSAGTSSRSTKLVHGGLRYLKQFEIKIVSEVGRERAIVYENGPHVTTPEWMLLPLQKGGTFGKFTTSLGLKIYDFLARVKKTERRKMLNSSETLDREPLLKQSGLKGSGYYVEYRTDDARLTIEVLKAAISKGAIALNYFKVESIIYENGLVTGALIQDLFSREDHTVKANLVVNATGPWVDFMREKDHSKHGKLLKLSKGVHVVIDQSRFPLQQAVYFDTRDGRMIFAIPRDGKTYVGTTDTFYDGDLTHPVMIVSDRTYLLNAINDMFPKVGIQEQDIESSWAGVRPLIYEEGKDPSEISRKDEIWVSHSGLITIAGGKLTGYRKMAETAVDLLVKKLHIFNHHFGVGQTKNLPISGGDVGGGQNFTRFVSQQTDLGIQAGLSEVDSKKIASRYGSNCTVLFDIVKQRGNEAEQFQLPLALYAKLVYSIENEMVATVVDFYFRRTGDLLFNISEVKKHKDYVTAYMAHRLQWTEAEIVNMKMDLENEIMNATGPLEDQVMQAKDSRLL